MAWPRAATKHVDFWRPGRVVDRERCTVEPDVALAKERVEAYLEEMGTRFEVDSDGDYSFRIGSARVFIRVQPVKDRVFVDAWAVTNRKVPPSPELFKHVATSNRYFFGSLAAHETDEGVTV